MERLSLDVLKDKKAPAMALLAVVINKYGVECFDWFPDTLREEIRNDYDVEITDLQSDMIQAAITIMSTNFFEEQWEVFKTCVHLLNGLSDSFEDFTPMEAEYIASALADYMLLKDGDDESEEFSDEVEAYIGDSFYHYGLSKAPGIFTTAIMPSYALECDDTGKNEALTEMFMAKVKYIKDYCNSLQLT